MRKHLSVLQFYIRASFLPFLALLAGMGAIEVGLFLLALSRSRAPEDGYFPSLEVVLDGSGMMYAGAIALLLAIALLASTGCPFGSKTGCTLGRLSISEGAVYFWQSGYTTFCCLIFWAAQLLLVLAFGEIYCRWAPAEAVSPQTILLAAYRNGFFNGLLPLSEPTGFVRNGLLCAALGLGAASVSHRSRRGKAPIQLILILILSYAFFLRTPGSAGRDWLSIFVMLAVLLSILHDVLRKEEESLEKT